MSLFERCLTLCYYEELMEINISFDEGLEGCLDAGWLKAIAENILTAQKISNNIEIGLLITSQQKIQQLNKAYRGKDMLTDVLAFTMFSESGNIAEADFTPPPDGVKHLGEVIISYPQAIIQAGEHHHSIKREVAILTIHGILHLLGYNHIKDKEAKEMETEEAKILGIINGEIE